LKLSVIVLSYNTRDLLRACLNSLRAHPPSHPMEVLVVDNGSADGSPAMVREAFPEAALIQTRANLGLRGTTPRPLFGAIMSNGRRTL
jgi:GT2 family glycosyltransferase